MWTYLPLAVKAGAEIRAECFAHGFELDAKGGISGVIYRHHGRDILQTLPRSVSVGRGCRDTTPFTPNRHSEFERTGR